MKLKMIALLAVLININMMAQLSGLYTINNSAPASSSNYTSFTAFASDLNTLGVSGAVTVNVAANTGTYTEQVTFNQATGISATNSVLINGNGNTLAFSSTNSAQPWTLLFNGADFITVSNLTIEAKGTYAYAFMLVGGADNNNLNNVNFICPANTTSSNHIPVVLSGASSNYYTAGNSGNNNTFNNCLLKSGYFSVVHYGLTGSPYNSDNKFLNCHFQDWYYYGVYSYYAKNLTVSGCLIDRPTHNGVGFGYGMYAYYNQGLMINGNNIRNFWGASPGNTNGAYPIYIYYNPLSGVGPQQNNVQNNVFSGFTNNSYIYAIYSYSQNGNILNNTIVFDNINNTYPGTFYGIYAYAGLAYPLTLKNNLIYFTQGGASTKYGIYYPTTSGITSNNNNFYINCPAGTNYVAYYNGDQTTLANLQSAGSDANSIAVDPKFYYASSNNFMPFSYAADNAGAPVGVTTDILNNSRSLTTPDIGAVEFFNVPCSGAPTSNTVTGIGITNICPGNSAFLNTANIYTTSGITFQWQSSTTSSVGLYSAISGATNQVYTNTVSNTTWYNAVVTCTNSGQSITITPGEVLVQGTTTNSVPYYEGFEGVANNNAFPNCSWAANSPTACLTYTAALNQNRIPNTGSKFASFYSAPTSTNYFYTNGIYLYSGVTYSTGLMYTTDLGGTTNWKDLSILLGTSQSTTGLVNVASISGTVSSTTYTALSNTFTVGSSGLYYFVVSASCDASATNYLSWDDFFVTIPCTLNNPTVSVNSGTICSGSNFTITPSGASTYTYEGGNSVVSPTTSISYTVVGTSSLGCVSSAFATSTVSVLSAPVLTVNSGAICIGNSFTITPSGANTYTYMNGNTVVSPTATSNYTVVGTATNGCISSVAISSVTVNPLPIIVASSSSGSICVGQTATLTASGAIVYVWNSASVSPVIVISPTVTTTYTVIGTGAGNCDNLTTVTQIVDPCAGVKEFNTGSSEVSIYPNPSNGIINIELGTLNQTEVTAQILNTLGKLMKEEFITVKNTEINITYFPEGVYFVKVMKGDNLVSVKKIVKQ